MLTDPVLSFSILLASYGFWRWMKCASKADAYLMFAGLGLGLLAKGPLTLVLMGAAGIRLVRYLQGMGTGTEASLD